ncbi:MAG: tetratricopeptide repeat protein, partial [candidate division Zixibacteria bacterium]|nr:tetratricopeptide repeat protein [candidate division Zixibacteria bacterium]
MAKQPKKNKSGRGRKSRPVPRKQTSPAAGKTVLDPGALEAAVRSNPGDLAAALALAEYYARQAAERKIVQTIERFESDYPISDPAQRQRYNRLLAFGYAHSDRCLDAERVINRGVADDGDSLDLSFVRSYVKLTLRDYRDVMEAADVYASLLDRARETQTTPTDITATPGHAAQLFNMLGVACRERGEGERAEEAFERALSFDAGNHLPYLNLARLYATGDRMDEARRIVAHGARHARNVQELLMLQQAYRKKATVSVCMIVKNEEELLPDCLESVRDWADEIVIVDTGSTDRTVEIAEQYGARIFHQAWEGDFSKHRNYSLEQATCDWIFIIDADERFRPEGLPGLRALLDRDDCSAISIDVYNLYRSGAGSMSFLPSVRFFRRSLGLRYEGIVHNSLNTTADTLVHRAPARIDHLGYDLSDDRMARKAVRTSSLLEQQLQENPDNTFALFNYAQLLCGRRADDVTANADRIISMASRAVQLTSGEPENGRHVHLMCLNQLAWTYFFTDRIEEAVSCADRALALKPDYLDPLLLRGHIAIKRDDRKEAIARYREYLEAQGRYDASQETESMIINHVDSRVNALYALGMIMELEGRPDEAKDLYRATLEIDPDYLDANAHLGRLLLAEGAVGVAEEHFNRQVATEQYSRETWLGMAHIAADRGDYAKAEEAIRRVLQHNPEDTEAVGRLGRLYQDMGRHEQAVEMFALARTHGTPAGKFARACGDSLFALGRFQDAVDSYNRVPEGSVDADLC